MKSLLSFLADIILNWLKKLILSDMDKRTKSTAEEVLWLRGELKAAQEMFAKVQKENQEIRESLMLQLQDANNKISNMKSTIHGLQTRISKQRKKIEELESEVKHLVTVNDAQDKTIAELKKLI